MSKKKTTTRIKPAQPNRYIVLRRYFDDDDDTYKYESEYMHEVGLSYEAALEFAKDSAEGNKQGGRYFVAQIVARAETIVNVAFEMEEYA